MCGGEEAKIVLQTVPIDQALISTSMSEIKNVPIFSNMSDNHIGWSLESQEKRNALSTASMSMDMAMNMNEITNCSHQKGLRCIGHVLQSISSDIIEIREDYPSSFSKDLTSSSIRSMASAPSTSTFNPPTAVPIAASLVVSANALGARDEYGVGSRRSPATLASSLSNQSNSSHNHSNDNSNNNKDNNNNNNSNNSNNNTEPKPKHTGASPSVVVSSEVDLGNRENCTASNPCQVLSNHSSIAFEIFKHPDDVVWGLDARSEPPLAVSRLICGIIETEVRASEDYAICANTQGASSVHGRSIEYDEGSDSQDILSHSVQSTDLARTPDPLLSPAPAPAPALGPVFYPFRTPNTDPAHVPVDLPVSALDTMTSIVTQLKDDRVRISDIEISLVGETRRDGDTITAVAVCGEHDKRASDTIEGKDKDKEWKTRSFVPRTRSKVRCSAPTYQATSSTSRTYLEEENVPIGRYKACFVTAGINAWIEESCEGEMEEDEQQEETVLSSVDIPLSHDDNRKSFTAPASIHTHSHRGVYSVLSVLLVRPLPNSQFSMMYFTTLSPPLSPFLRLLLFFSISMSPMFLPLSPSLYSIFHTHSFLSVNSHHALYAALL